MKKKVLLLLCVAIFFPDRREEKPIDALVCDLFCSQTGEKRYLLMLLCMILFVSRRGENKIDALECDPFCS